MAQPVRPRVDAATVTSVADLNTVQTLKAANASRTALFICNNSSALLYVKLGSAASTTDFTVIIAANGGFWELPTDNVVYTGIVTGIWASDSTGAALITELA